jgi:hypothetical protein
MKDYCPKCKKWLNFGRINPNYFVKKQMETNKIEGTPQELYQKDKKKFEELCKKGLEEDKLIDAGCKQIPNCIKCRTELIEQQR